MSFWDLRMFHLSYSKIKFNHIYVSYSLYVNYSSCLNSIILVELNNVLKWPHFVKIIFWCWYLEREVKLCRLEHKEVLRLNGVIIEKNLPQIFRPKIKNIVLLLLKLFEDATSLMPCNYCKVTSDYMLLPPFQHSWIGIHQPQMPLLDQWTSFHQYI